MQNRRFWNAALSLVLFAAALQVNASSEIPERREFPVNPSVSPCQDFYEHACSSVVSGFDLREDRSKHIFAFSDSHERLLDAKKKFLLGLPNRKSLSPRAKALSNVYQACLDEKASAAEEKDFVAKIVKEVSGLSSHSDFQKYQTKKMDDAQFSFLDWGTVSNLDDSDWNDIYILADLSTLPERSYYDKKEVVGDLESLAKAFFETIGMDNAAQRAKWVVEFEKEFAQSYPLPAEMRELFNVKTGISRGDLKKKYPSFQLTGFVDKLPKRTHFRNITPDNFTFVNQALSKQPLDVLKSVYLFHALPEYLDDAYPDYFKKGFEFRRKHLGGPNVRPVRQERCTLYVMERFAKEIDAELLTELFPSFPEAKFIKLVESVRASIIKGIEKNKWLSPGSKKAAINKVRVAKLQLVKPRNDAEWNFNPPAEYSPKTPYANNRLLEKKLMEKELRELGIRRDRSRWEMGPLTVNAYYSPSDNKFVLPIGILQYPFYDPKLPDTVNLGAVGMVVGHELGHGIDDHGARYDSTGRLKQWMSDKDVKEFGRRGSQLIAQFNAIGHDGKLTLGENIGDLVGLTFAYNAAFPASKGTRAEKQGFFLQYARTWCGVIRPKLREMIIKTDPHALVEARVNEQVKHQPGFQEAFECKPGDPMMLPPEKRVIIW